VEIWHCDAGGVYSGYESLSQGANGTTPDTSHAADTIFAAAGRGKAVLKLGKRPGGKPGYRGTITLGVATS
jgi:hypothetical protein